MKFRHSESKYFTLVQLREWGDFKSTKENFMNRLHKTIKNLLLLTAAPVLKANPDHKYYYFKTQKFINLNYIPKPNINCIIMKSEE